MISQFPSDHQHQSDLVERLKESPRSSSSINDLPDLVLVEILCRLPLKSTFQCKCVSRSWYLLMSSPYFVLLRREQQREDQRTLIFSNDIGVKTEFFSINKHPVFKIHTKRNFSFSFLPFYGSTRTEPIVVGTYNDLVCCCATWRNQCHYYICNPYTKQWVALPPTPRCHKEVRAGFICSPKEEDGDRKQEYHKYKIVQIIIPDDLGVNSSFEFNLQIFCSESGKWTEAVASSPRRFYVNHLSCDAIAHNGMLYWWGFDFLIGFNPYSSDTSCSTTDVDHHIYCCRFIGKPVEQFAQSFDFLNVWQGRLRISQSYRNPDRQTTGFSIWEFKDDGHQVDGGKWCLVDTVDIRQMIADDPLIYKWDHARYWKKCIMVLGFDPHNDEVLYLELCQHLVRYNIRTRTLKKVTFYPYKGSPCPRKRVFPFVIPPWPTLQHQYAYACPS
ncbi:uncharacterized protein Pyn_30453 [Prunus yedoensis var. nudiflora]|uniref:F-box domain-containing protein n=1 Tax=Prunus yedoensis var. nudiflora TaxID=2094558 RepID=A0A314ZDQ7_PRUYE|nr:uncharacterized protein Pyn_30453 [Prunus yedoensis var. nudiflora]